MISGRLGWPLDTALPFGLTHPKRDNGLTTLLGERRECYDRSCGSGSRRIPRPGGDRGSGTNAVVHRTRRARMVDRNVGGKGSTGTNLCLHPVAIPKCRCANRPPVEENRL